MEDNVGSMPGMNGLNQRETLRVEKSIQITLAFRSQLYPCTRMVPVKGRWDPR